MKNTFKLSIFFHSVYKTNIDCFLFGAQFKIIGPWWCQNHDYALSFTSGIVMVLTSPRAYNFNCAPQSSQYLYNILHIIMLLINVHKFTINFYFESRLILFTCTNLCHKRRLLESLNTPLRWLEREIFGNTWFLAFFVLELYFGSKHSHCWF